MCTFAFLNKMPRLHLHLQVSCHSMRLFSLVPDTRLNTLTFKFFTTSRTYNVVTTAFTCFNVIRKKHRISPINIKNLWSYFTFLIVH